LAVRQPVLPDRLGARDKTDERRVTRISFRSDDETDKALAVLIADGSGRSEAIRRALRAEARRQRQERIRRDALRLASDPDDIAEMRAVNEDMDAVRAR
jgi:metal-responsive CopG/Arc/MetJ family transcriptional regulator